jgi:hypothetical protein
VSKNLNRRAHVILPIDVVADMDKLVGKRGRSAFLTELAQREIKIRHQREVLRETAGRGSQKTIPSWLKEPPPGYGKCALSTIGDLKNWNDAETVNDLPARFERPDRHPE